MRGNGWLLTYDIWRNLRIRMPMLFAVLDELEDAGLVESQWCECFTPRRRVYRLIQEERP
jgi:DNA-binding PadR family transcriptional regulator